MESIYTGLFFIAVGILVKFFPNLIAGYNQESSREKENAITNGLPSFLSIVFIIMGVLVFVGHLIAERSDMPSNINITVLVSLVGTVVMIVFGQRFTRER